MICLRIRSANGIRLVLVERADRRVRNLMVSEVLLAEFRKLDSYRYNRGVGHRSHHRRGRPDARLDIGSGFKLDVMA
jgi:hypothetical protein